MGSAVHPGYWYTGARWKQSNQASQTSSYSVEASNSSTTSVTLMHTATDDGLGEIAGGMGSVLYSAKSLNLKVVADFQATSFKSSYENASSFETSSNVTDTQGSVTPGSTSTGGSSNTKGGEYGTQEFKENFGANSLVVRYKTGVGVPQSATESYTPPAVTLDLVPYTTEAVVPGSVRFTWMGTVYEDFEGVIYRGRTSSNAGVASGTIDYESGVATMSDYVVSGNPASFTLDSLWTRKGRADPIATIAFNTELSPIKPGGLVLSVVDVAGNQLIATADINGRIMAEHVYGSIDYATGLVEIQFGDFVTAANLTDAEKTEWWYDPDDVFTTGALTGKLWRPWPVLPETLRYNAVAYTYLPLDADILGLDPVRLPSDGRVPIFRPGGFAVVGNTGELTATVSNGQTLNCGRVRLSRVRVLGADGNVIHTGYSVDLEAGLVTFENVSGYSQPVTVQHRIEDMVLVSDVQITGRLKFTRPLTHEYPAQGSYVSSALVAGDLFAQVNTVFDQSSWSNAWADTLSGSAATGTFNATQFPIRVTNRGAITERWAIKFTNTTSFEIIGEHVGVIATGNTSTDCAPLNPATGVPYFVIPAAGWGSGWATGNVLRMNTVGAMFPVWMVRTVQQGPETVLDDRFTVLIRGDVNANPQ
jgi:hypothetical protein